MFTVVFSVDRVWKRVVQQGDALVDATCGNGYDTLAMVKMVANKSQTGRVYAMDVQKIALDNTLSLLDQSLNQDEVLTLCISIIDTYEVLVFFCVYFIIIHMIVMFFLPLTSHLFSTIFFSTNFCCDRSLKIVVLLWHAKDSYYGIFATWHVFRSVH